MLKLISKPKTVTLYLCQDDQSQEFFQLAIFMENKKLYTVPLQSLGKNDPRFAEVKEEAQRLFFRSMLADQLIADLISESFKD